MLCSTVWLLWFATAMHGELVDAGNSSGVRGFFFFFFLNRGAKNWRAKRAKFLELYP